MVPVGFTSCKFLNTMGFCVTSHPEGGPFTCSDAFTTLAVALWHYLLDMEFISSVAWFEFLHGCVPTSYKGGSSIPKYKIKWWPSATHIEVQSQWYLYSCPVQHWRWQGCRVESSKARCRWKNAMSQIMPIRSDSHRGLYPFGVLPANVYLQKLSSVFESSSK